MSGRLCRHPRRTTEESSAILDRHKEEEAIYISVSNYFRARQKTLMNALEGRLRRLMATACQWRVLHDAAEHHGPVKGSSAVNAASASRQTPIAMLSEPKMRLVKNILFWSPWTGWTLYAVIPDVYYQ